ncbi:hypothetical protein M1O16_04735 [Dehalococcoidia bacterium]|nr:hypothetical protein [Dehalococcoidia bacterium]
MGSIVVQNHMDIFLFGSFPLDQPEKLEEFLMAMPRLTLGNYTSIGYIESAKKASSSVPFVIVDMPFHLSRPKWQHRSCPIQKLNLTLLVYCEHQCILRGMQIQSHDVNNLRKQFRVVAIF